MIIVSSEVEPVLVYGQVLIYAAELDTKDRFSHPDLSRPAHVRASAFLQGSRGREEAPLAVLLWQSPIHIPVCRLLEIVCIIQKALAQRRKLFQISWDSHCNFCKILKSKIMLRFTGNRQMSTDKKTVCYHKQKQNKTKYIIYKWCPLMWS